MKSDECLGLHSYKRVAPVEEPCERNHCETNCGRCPTRPCVALLQNGQLSSKEKILGQQGDVKGKNSRMNVSNFVFYKSLRPAFRTQFLRTTRIMHTRGLAY